MHYKQNESQRHHSSLEFKLNHKIPTTHETFLKHLNWRISSLTTVGKPEMIMLSIRKLTVAEHIEYKVAFR